MKHLCFPPYFLLNFLSWSWLLESICISWFSVGKNLNVFGRFLNVAEDGIRPPSLFTCSNGKIDLFGSINYLVSLILSFLPFCDNNMTFLYFNPIINYSTGIVSLFYFVVYFVLLLRLPWILVCSPTAAVNIMGSDVS